MVLMISLVVLIMIFLFAMGVIAFSYQAAILLLVNVAILGIIYLRTLRDFKQKDKKIFAAYVLAIGISLLIYAMLINLNAIPSIYNLLPRMGINAAVQAILLYFIIANLSKLVLLRISKP